MTQAMILMGILALCAISGVLLKCRSRWAPGPDEPSGSYTAPPPMPGPRPALPSPPPVAAMPSPPPVTAASPGKPSQPVHAVLSVPPPSASPVTSARRGRNSGFARFSPAPARARTGRA